MTAHGRQRTNRVRGMVRRGLLLAAVCVALGFDDARAEPSVVAAAPEQRTWWRDAVIYEIYPRSFRDSNGDGVGDLNGISEKLGYLQSLGVDAIWIAPMYPSPQVDFGYDIADYQSVDPQYGSLADFDRLVAQARGHHIRVILDMVLNHTSDKHPWFLEAAASRTSAHHDFYVWNDGKIGSAGERLPPNNWISLFGGSAWQPVPAIDQFYYHMFYKQQPDLNWRNPSVESAMFDAMRFWLDRGVAGFRLDAITMLFEDAQLREETPLGGTNLQGDPNLSHEHTDNLPEAHAVIRRMRNMVDEYPGERVLIGETYVPKTADLDAWYGGDRHDELNLSMDTLLGLGKTLDAARFRRLLGEANTELHGSQPLFVFDNHDQIRSWDRYGDGAHDEAIAKLLATLLLTSRSAVLLYQGEEIGQRTHTPTRLEDVKDPIGISGWPKEKGRDGERTPMQWDTSNRQAGFSDNPHTWLPVPLDYETVNVRRESADRQSLLSWHRRLIALRRSSPALRDGDLGLLDGDNPSVLTYARVGRDGRAIVVALNMSASTQTIAPNLDQRGAGRAGFKTLMSNQASLSDPARGRVTLLPFGSWVGSN
ncbi:MAG: alpha amylase catalytic region [Gammaproteobacteria bacterium]|nr:alpha amylase catalytic region [Gammaproteobacteria bacterium]